MRRAHPLALGSAALALLFACSGPSATARQDGPGHGGGEDAGTSTARGSAHELPAQPGPPRVDFVGRFDTRDPAGPKCGWPGCRIVARFQGTKVSARLEELTEPWMEGGPSEWDVTIDGARRPKLVMKSGPARDYVLATDLPAGEHVVELYKRSEAQTGGVQFHGYDFGDGALLAPPVRRPRLIEIVGDSAAAGFGVEGVDVGPKCPGLDYAATWQNFHVSFGARLGEALDAEVTGTVYSGKGLVKNIWRSDEITMPKVFPLAMPVDPTSTWDFSELVPDAALIMIGGNDFAIGQPSDDGPATLSEFTNAYDDFVVTIRQSYPAAHVFLVTSPSVSDAEPPGRSTRTHIMSAIETVVERRQRAGDDRVYGVTPPVASRAELTGCDGHGSPEFHRRVAADLAPLVRAKTGW